MTTVRVLVDAVGQWNKGDIVKDAPPGLVEMAEAGTINIATGERVAEIVNEEVASKTGSNADELKELKVLQAKAAELQIADSEKMSRDELTAAIEAAGGGKGAE
jgi:hypothetical protein